MRIIRADPTDGDKLSTALTESMYHDPMCFRVFSDRESNVKYFGRFWKAILEYTFRYGTVFAPEDRSGVLCLVHPGNSIVTVPRLLATRFGLATSLLRFPFRERNIAIRVFGRLETMQAKLLPGPHWYVISLGVRPGDQGKGVGTSLLAAMDEAVKSIRQPIYLETETERNVHLYERHGFEVIKEIFFRKPGLRYYLMARYPAPEQVPG